MYSREEHVYEKREEFFFNTAFVNQRFVSQLNFFHNTGKKREKVQQELKTSFYYFLLVTPITLNYSTLIVF